jgi:hypothetical protein
MAVSGQVHASLAPSPPAPLPWTVRTRTQYWDSWALGLHSQSGWSVEDNNLLSVPRIDYRFLSCRIRGLDTIPTELPAFFP